MRASPPVVRELREEGARSRGPGARTGGRAIFTVPFVSGRART